MANLPALTPAAAPSRSRLDNLDELRTFTAIVEAGSLAARATTTCATAARTAIYEILN